MGTYRVAVKASAVAENSEVKAEVGGTDTVLSFESRAKAKLKATDLSELGDRTLSLQNAAPQDETDIDAYLVSYDGPGRRWEVIRAEVKKRDRYTCQRCGEEKGYERRDELDVHHITPKSEGGSDKKDNLTTWCKDCHHHVHAEEKRNGTLAELKAFIQDYPKPYILPKEVQSETDISLIEGKLWKLTTRWDDLGVMEYWNHVVFYRFSNRVDPDDFLFTHDSWNTKRTYDADSPFRDASILQGPVFYKDDIIVEGWAEQRIERDETFQCPECGFRYVQDPDQRLVAESLGDGDLEYDPIPVDEQLDQHQQEYCPGLPPADLCE